jgi:hypothetical protein
MGQETGKEKHPTILTTCDDANIGSCMETVSCTETVRACTEVLNMDQETHCIHLPPLRLIAEGEVVNIEVQPPVQSGDLTNWCSGVYINGDQSLHTTSTHTVWILIYAECVVETTLGVSAKFDEGVELQCALVHSLPFPYDIPASGGYWGGGGGGEREGETGQ